MKFGESQFKKSTADSQRGNTAETEKVQYNSMANRIDRGKARI
jgi:hypothetical protein